MDSLSDIPASLAIYVSFLGAALALVSGRVGLPARFVALATTTLGLLISLVAVMNCSRPELVEPFERATWVASLGIEFFLGADGISLTLVLLTGIASVAAVLFSWKITHRANEYYALLLTLIGAVYGVFMSFDLFLLFVFYEIAIVPKYFLIAIWGGGEKRYAAMKLALYSFIGSAMVLIGIIGVYAAAGAKTTNMLELAQVSFPVSFQLWAFPMIFVGFAILAGMWPFHTWAPTGHAAAPTPISMLLAGVIMKLGAYGALRVAVAYFPDGLFYWKDTIACLAVIGITYGAGVAMVQSDFKFVIGYSSVSHMGFVILGLVTVNEIGLSGAVLQMFSHGIIAGLLFAVVGGMIYERTHTRDMTELEAMRLSKKLPFASGVFVVAGFASMGMPGFSGFVAELQVLVGAWNASPKFALFAGVGVVIGVTYTLRAMNQVFFADPPSSSVASEKEFDPISRPEIVGATLLLITTLVVGLYPRVLLDLIMPAVRGPFFQTLLGGNAS